MPVFISSALQPNLTPRKIVQVMTDHRSLAETGRTQSDRLTAEHLFALRRVSRITFQRSPASLEHEAMKQSIQLLGTEVAPLRAPRLSHTRNMTGKSKWVN